MKQAKRSSVFTLIPVVNVNGANTLTLAQIARVQPPATELLTTPKVNIAADDLADVQRSSRRKKAIVSEINVNTSDTAFLGTAD